MTQSHPSFPRNSGNIHGLGSTQRSARPDEPNKKYRQDYPPRDTETQDTNVRLGSVLLTRPESSLSTDRSSESQQRLPGSPGTILGHPNRREEGGGRRDTRHRNSEGAQKLRGGSEESSVTSTEPGPTHDPPDISTATRLDDVSPDVSPCLREPRDRPYRLLAGPNLQRHDNPWVLTGVSGGADAGPRRWTNWDWSNPNCR